MKLSDDEQIGPQSSRRHHFVPEFYLRNWVGDDGRLTVVRNIDGRIVRSTTTPKHTGFEKDLYSYDAAYKSPDRAEIERILFQPLDERGAMVLRKIIANEALSNQDKQLWCQFLAAQRVRTPTSIKRLKEMGEKYWKKHFTADDERYGAAKSPQDPESFDEWVERESPGLRESVAIGQLPKLLTNPKLMSSIMALRWVSLDLQGATKRLVTGDNPAVFTTGLQDPNCVIAMPLTPTHAFFAFKANSVAEAAIMRQSASVVAAALNENVVGQAQARVYMPPTVAVPEAFILKWLSASDNA